MSPLEQKYEILLAYKDMEIAQLTEEAIRHLEYLIVLQEDFRRANVKPSQRLYDVEMLIAQARVRRAAT